MRTGPVDTALISSRAAGRGDILQLLSQNETSSLENLLLDPSQHQKASFSSCPIEIVEMIFAYCNQATLATCCSVSGYLGSIAKPMLLRNVVIDNTECYSKFVALYSDQKLKLDTSLIHSLELISSTKNVKSPLNWLYYDSINPASLFRLLCCSIQSFTLTLRGDTHSALRHACQHWINRFSTVTNLSLNGVEISLGYLAQFYTLKTLSLRRIVTQDSMSKAERKKFTFSPI